MIADALRRNIDKVMPAGYNNEDRWRALQVVLVFTAIVGAAMLLSSFFLTSTWGRGAGFQAVITSVAHLAYCAYSLSWFKRRDSMRADFIGGISLGMNLLLLETAVLWGSFAGGLNLQSGNVIVPINESTFAERAMTAFSSIALMGHLIIGALVYTWRYDILDDFGGSGKGKYAPVGGGGSNVPISSASFSNPPTPAANGINHHHHGGYQNETPLTDADLKSLSSFVIGEDDEENHHESEEL